MRSPRSRLRPPRQGRNHPRGAPARSPAAARAGPSPSSGRAPAPRPDRPGSPRARSRVQPTVRVEAGEEVMRGEVLERLEALPQSAHVPGVRIEEGRGFANGEIARRPRARSREVAREEPIRRPLAAPANRHKPSPDLLVRKLREGRVVDLLRGDPDDVLGLAPREAEPDELVRIGT